MIFRNNNLSAQSEPSPLQRIQAYIKNDGALRICILDASEDDGVLVVFCTEEPMVNIVKLTLQNHWPGEIEVFYPSGLMTGSKEPAISSGQHYQNMGTQLRYVN